MRTICQTSTGSKTIRAFSMSKQSKAEPNRSADGAKHAFACYEHAETGLNAVRVPDAPAGYWTRVLAHVKERSESAAPKKA